MHPILYIFSTDTGPNLVLSDFLHLASWDSIRERDIPEARRASGTKLTVSGSITSHLRIGELHTDVILDVVDELAVAVLLVTTFLDFYISSFHPMGTKLVPYHFMAVPILVVHDARSVAKKKEDWDSTVQTQETRLYR